MEPSMAAKRGSVLAVSVERRRMLPTERLMALEGEWQVMRARSLARRGLKKGCLRVREEPLGRKTRRRPVGFSKFVSLGKNSSWLRPPEMTGVMGIAISKGR